MSKSSIWGRMAMGLAASLFAFGVQAAVDIPKPTTAAAPTPAKAPPIQPVDAKKCYSCHEDIEDFHTKGRHASVNCAHCHDNAAEHLKLAKGKDWGVRPNTIKDHRACATCHVEQYNSFVQTNMDSKARVEKASFKSRSPLFDKLMAPHGFTKEHNEPRSHVFMTDGPVSVDRAYGGRFQFKDWTYITDAEGCRADALERDPGRQGPHPHRPEGLHAPGRHRRQPGLHELQDLRQHPGLEVHG